jgi:hypothetical protein
MMRRCLLAVFTILTLAAGRADAVTVRDVIELTKAGLSDPVLLALIEVDQSVFKIDAETLKQLKAGGVSDAVIVAMIRSGRTPPPVEPAPAVEAVPTEPAPAAPEPQVIVIDHYDQQPMAYPVPVAVPVYVPTPAGAVARRGTIRAPIETDQGVVTARVPVPPNCVKAEPVYWGFGGKLRPGSWTPPPTVVCK